MDITLFRRYLLTNQQNKLTESHRGIKSDGSLKSYSSLENAKNVSATELAQVKKALSSVRGVYEIGAYKELNTIRTLSYLDVDPKLPFVVSLRLHVSRGPKNAPPEKTYEVAYGYSLIPREYGDPQYVKKYRTPSREIVSADKPIFVYLDDLDLLDPYESSYIKTNLSKWKTLFGKRKPD